MREAVAVLGRGAEQVADDVDREREAEGRLEVGGLPALDHVVEQGLGDPRHAGAQGRHAFRGEVPADLAPPAQMGLAGLRDRQRVLGGRVGRDTACAVGGEPRGVVPGARTGETGIGEEGADVVVTAHERRPVAARQLDRGHRAPRPQPLPRGGRVQGAVAGHRQPDHLVVRARAGPVLVVLVVPARLDLAHRGISWWGEGRETEMHATQVVHRASMVHHALSLHGAIST